MTDAGDDLGPVLLDRLAGAATVAPLASGEVDGDRLGGQGQPGRHALDDDPEARGRATPRRSGSGTRVGHAPQPAAAGRRRRRLALGRLRSPARAGLLRASACMSSSGAGWPVHSVNAAAPWWRSISSPSAAASPAATRVAEQPRRGCRSRSRTSRSGGRSSPGIGVSSACEADRGRVDEDPGLRQLRLDDRLVPGHRPELHVGGAPAEVLDQASARWRCRLKTTIRRKPSVMSPWTTARAPPPAPRTTAWRGIFCRPTRRVEGDLEAGHVGVVADQPLALAA